MVDVVAFTLESIPRVPGAEEIHIKVNGRDLIEVIASIERDALRRGREPSSLAGSYSGYSPGQLGQPIVAHFLGAGGSDLECGPIDKTALLDCECGFPGCWTLMARITKTADVVVWTDFWQVRFDEWPYDGLTMTFDRHQYESALAEIEAVARGRNGPDRRVSLASTRGPSVSILTLQVSNRSSAHDPVGIQISIDGDIVVDDDFFVGNQYNWMTVEITLPTGEHEVRMRSSTGAERTAAVTTAADSSRGAVVGYWCYLVGPDLEEGPRWFSFTVDEGPI